MFSKAEIPVCMAACFVGFWNRVALDAVRKMRARPAALKGSAGGRDVPPIKCMREMVPSLGAGAGHGTPLVSRRNKLRVPDTRHRTDPICRRTGPVGVVRAEGLEPSRA